MRNPWRLLLLRNFTRFSRHSVGAESLHLQVRKLGPENPHFLSSILGRNAHLICVSLLDSDVKNHRFRNFSSEPALEHKELDHATLTEIFSKSSSYEEVKTELESINASVSHEMVLEMLKNLEGNPVVAWRFFNWLTETGNDGLNSKAYNLMLRILGRKDHVKEFWDLFEITKKKGFGVSKDTYIKVLENFEKEEMTNDLDKLKKMYDSKSDEVSTEVISSRICKLINENEWDEDFQKRLGDLNVSWSHDLVAMVLEHSSAHPTKALMFFWWIEENPSFKHNKQTYNTMANVLGREDYVEKFWRVVDEMKEAGYEMEMETYFKVSGRFYDRRMIKDVVDLHELMMRSATKPPVRDSLFLLQKIVVGKNLDMDLFSRVVKTSMEIGNGLTKSTLDAILKSLTSVGRLHECGNILKAMEKGGYAPSNAAYRKYIFQLSKAGRPDEALAILNEMEVSGSTPDVKIWASLIEGRCIIGDVKKASFCFRKMVERNVLVDASNPLDTLVNAFCKKNKPGHAYKFLTEMVNSKQLRPWHTTYKSLIKALLVQRRLEEALGLLPLMKDHGFPPYVDPFIEHISKSGTGDDAISFLKAMTLKSFPSTSVVIRMFEAFFKAGRHSEAQKCLVKCPRFIRNHADILNLFCDMKREHTAPAPALSA